MILVIVLTNIDVNVLSRCLSADVAVADLINVLTRGELRHLLEQCG